MEFLLFNFLLIFLLIKLFKNKLKIKLEKIKLEKIYVKIKVIFMYFQSSGFFEHISKGCIPKVITISSDI